MDDIDGWRREIDNLDEQLVQLMNRRAECAIEIGRIKAASGLDVENLSRESDVFEHVKAINSGPLSEETMSLIFRTLIDSCKRLET